MTHPLVKHHRYEHWNDLAGAAAGILPLSGMAPINGFVLVLEVDHSTRPDPFCGGTGLDIGLLEDLTVAAMAYLHNEGEEEIVRFLRIVEARPETVSKKLIDDLEKKVRSIEGAVFQPDESKIPYLGTM